MSNEASNDSAAFTFLDSQLSMMLTLIENMESFLKSSRSASIPEMVYDGVNRLNSLLPQFHKMIKTLEEEREGFRALSQIGQVVNSSLDLKVVLQIVMDTIIRLTGAERGFLMLHNDEGQLVNHIARNWEQETLDLSGLNTSRTVINRVVDSGKAVLTTNAQEDKRFAGQESVVAYNLRSIICVPLKVKGEVTGVIYTDNRIRSGLFTQKELDLLIAFSNHAAVAIENARLFDSVKGTLAEVTDLKNLMDNVFASMVSGVLTADIEERIMLCNLSAEKILGRTSLELVGNDLKTVLPSFAPLLIPYFDQVIKTDQQILDVETSTVIPERGQLDLRFSLSPLKDVKQSTQGVAIVIEDLTEKRKLEAQRRLFERMVAPAVIARLDANSLQLGGQRSTITVLFADIRGFTSFSEDLAPEELVSILNRYLKTAADAVLSEDGTIDKFLGDAIMAWFNAPILQPDHTARAVRAALRIRDSLENLHRDVPSKFRLSFGVGIHVGEAVLGLVGTEKRSDYTAIGDSVNTAKRIQEYTGPGQILISQEGYELVSDQIDVIPFEPIKVKGKRELLKVYDVIQLKQK
jgi:adenylate cyclase